MAGKFERKRFSEFNLNDPFFDSLKADYPGTSSSTGFVQWFTKKLMMGREPWYLKMIKKLADGGELPKIARLKITTIKIDERYRNQRIGEGALGLTLWQWRDLGINEIYVTVFDKHASLIFLLEKYGFVHVGNNLIPCRSGLILAWQMDVCNIPMTSSCAWSATNLFIMKMN